MTCYDLRFPEFARRLVDAGRRADRRPRRVGRGAAQGPTTGGPWSPRGPSRTPSTSPRSGSRRRATPATRWSSTRSATSSPRPAPETRTEPVVLTAEVDRTTLADARRTNPSLANRRLARLIARVPSRHPRRCAARCSAGCSDGSPASRRRRSRWRPGRCWSSPGPSLLVCAMVPTGPDWLGIDGSVIVGPTYAWALAARTGGRPVIFGTLALALGLLAVWADQDIISTGTAGPDDRGRRGAGGDGDGAGEVVLRLGPRVPARDGPGRRSARWRRSGSSPRST